MVYMQQPVHIIDGVYLGGVPALRQRDFLLSKCVTHVLKLFVDYEVYAYPDPVKAVLPNLPSWLDELAALNRDFTVLDLPQPLDKSISDASFKHGLDYMRKQIAAGHHVMILSRERSNRAPIFMIVYLMEERRYPFTEAFTHVVKLNRSAGIGLNPKSWQSLLDHYHLPYTMDDLWRGFFDNL